MAAVTADTKHSRIRTGSPTETASSRTPSNTLMITAIVLIKAEPRSIQQCATKLAGIEGVSQV